LTVFTFYRLVFYRCLHVCSQLRSDSCAIKETFDLISSQLIQHSTIVTLQTSWKQYQ